MNISAFKHLYQYHVSENRQLIAACLAVKDPSVLTEASPYSIGSIHDQLVHLLMVDDIWFSNLIGIASNQLLENPNDVQSNSYSKLLDEVVAKFNQLLGQLSDADLFTKPFADGNDEGSVLYLWQALIQVINHGTDHRAQILPLLAKHGIKTNSQDYVFFAHENPVQESHVIQ